MPTRDRTVCQSKVQFKRRCNFVSVRWGSNGFVSDFKGKVWSVADDPDESKVGNVEVILTDMANS